MHYSKYEECKINNTTYTQKNQIRKKANGGTSLMVQWLRLRAPYAGSPGCIPGQGTRSHMPQLKDPACREEDPARGNEDPAQPDK